MAFPWLIFQIAERLEKPDNFAGRASLKNPKLSGLTTCLTTYENKLKIEKNRGVAQLVARSVRDTATGLETVIFQNR